MTGKNKTQENPGLSDPGHQTLKARLLVADALFEAARAGERGETFSLLLEAWLNWFMDGERVRPAGTGEAFPSTSLALSRDH